MCSPHKNLTQNTKAFSTNEKKEAHTFFPLFSFLYFNNTHTTRTQQRQKRITGNSRIPELVPHTENHQKKIQNTRARSTRGKYNMKLHNTRARKSEIVSNEWKWKTQRKKRKV